ncbi:hypothetical protein LTR85_000520 [Meristemomyces frigidus]|nr:hypothetical protein LTR85_000520 [Meristemomyces frigidus]
MMAATYTNPWFMCSAAFSVFTYLSPKSLSLPTPTFAFEPPLEPLPPTDAPITTVGGFTIRYPNGTVTGGDFATLLLPGFNDTVADPSSGVRHPTNSTYEIAVDGSASAARFDTIGPILLGCLLAGCLLAGCLWLGFWLYTASQKAQHKLLDDLVDTVATALEDIICINEQLVAQIEASRGDLRSSQDKVTALEDASAKKYEKIIKVEHANAEQVTKLEQSVIDISHLRTERDDLSVQVTAAQGEKDELESSHEKERIESKAIISRLEHDLQTARVAGTDARKQVESLEMVREKQHDELIDAHAQIQTKHEDMRALQQENEMQRSWTSYHKSRAMAAEQRCELQSFSYTATMEVKDKEIEQMRETLTEWKAETEASTIRCAEQERETGELKATVSRQEEDGRGAQATATDAEKQIESLEKMRTQQHCELICLNAQVFRQRSTAKASRSAQIGAAVRLLHARTALSKCEEDKQSTKRDLDTAKKIQRTLKASHAKNLKDAEKKNDDECQYSDGLRDDLDTRTEERDTAEQELGDARDKIKRLQDHSDRDDDTIRDLERDLDGARKGVQQLEGDRPTQEKETRGTETEGLATPDERLGTDNESVNANMEDVQPDEALDGEDGTGSIDELTSVKQKVADLEDELKKEKEEGLEISEQIVKLYEENDDLRAALKNATKKSAEARGATIEDADSVADATAHTSELGEKCAKLQKRCDKLETRMSACTCAASLPTGGGKDDDDDDGDEDDKDDHDAGANHGKDGEGASGDQSGDTSEDGSYDTGKSNAHFSDTPSVEESAPAPTPLEDHECDGENDTISTTPSEPSSTGPAHGGSTEPPTASEDEIAGGERNASPPMIPSPLRAQGDNSTTFGGDGARAGRSDERGARPKPRGMSASRFAGAEDRGIDGVEASSTDKPKAKKRHRAGKEQHKALKDGREVETPGGKAALRLQDSGSRR